MSDHSEILALMDKHTPRSALSRVGLSALQVRAAARPATPLPAAAVRRALARTWRKNSHGAAAMPAYVVAAMHAEYLRVGSLREAAAAFGRTKQNLAYIFRRRGLQLRGRGGPNHKKAA